MTYREARMQAAKQLAAAGVENEAAESWFLMEAVCGISRSFYLLHEQEGETAMEREIAHDLIVVIANQGSTDLVMDAAREAGATGGTVIHAKGTGMEGAEKFLGISLAAEKEMIYIVVHRDKRNEIMSAIMRDAGMASKAKSICFTLPVSATAGLRLLEDD